MKQVMRWHTMESLIYNGPFDAPRHLPVTNAESYRRLCEESMVAPERYWSTLAQELDWMVPWREPFERDGDRIDYFVGGYGNVSSQMIDRYLETGSERLALVAVNSEGPARHWTVRELYLYVASAARHLTTLGISHHDRVALIMPGQLETYAVLLACLRLGVEAIVMTSETPARAVAETLQVFQPRAIVSTAETIRDGLSVWQDRDSALKQVVAVGQPYTGGAIEVSQWQASYGAHMELLDAHPVSSRAIGIRTVSDVNGHLRWPSYRGIGWMLGASHDLRYVMDLGPGDVIYAMDGPVEQRILDGLASLALGATVMVYEGRARDLDDDQRGMALVQGLSHVLVSESRLQRWMTKKWAPRAFSSLRRLTVTGPGLADVSWFSRLPSVSYSHWYRKPGSSLAAIPGLTAMVPGAAGLPLPGAVAAPHAAHDFGPELLDKTEVTSYLRHQDASGLWWLEDLVLTTSDSRHISLRWLERECCRALGAEDAVIAPSGAPGQVMLFAEDPEGRGGVALGEMLISLSQAWGVTIEVLGIPRMPCLESGEPARDVLMAIASGRLERLDISHVVDPPALEAIIRARIAL